MKLRVGCVITAWLAMMLCAVAQQVGLNTGAASASAPVPRLIKYSGIAKDDNGKPNNWPQRRKPASTPPRSASRARRPLSYK